MVSIFEGGKNLLCDLSKLGKEYFMDGAHVMFKIIASVSKNGNGDFNQMTFT